MDDHFAETLWLLFESTSRRRRAEVLLCFDDGTRYFHRRLSPWIIFRFTSENIRRDLQRVYFPSPESIWPRANLVSDQRQCIYLLRKHLQTNKEYTWADGWEKGRPQLTRPQYNSRYVRRYSCQMRITSSCDPPWQIDRYACAAAACVKLP